MKSKFIITTVLTITFLYAFSTNTVFAKTNTKTNKSYERNSDSTYTYKVPSRMIVISPYFSYIYTNNLFVNTIKDQSGFGGGLDIRTQIYGNFGYMLDVLYTNLEIVEEEVIPGITEEEKSDLVAVFTAGFYYSLYYFSFADMRIDMGYGAITAGDNVMTIFVPGIEFFKHASDRIRLFAKISYLITNDWFVNLDYKEHYTSFSLSAGLSVIF